MKHLLIFLALLLAACTGGGPFAPPGSIGGPGGGSTPNTPIGRTYAYTSRDSAGQLLVAGTLTFTSFDSTRVGGSWSFRAIGNSTKMGPQVGNGTFAGLFHGAVLLLNLNPQYVDNNVYLSGTFASGGVFAGAWSWSSFIGPTGGGTFRADPIR